MQINYCLPIIKNNKEEILEIIEKNISEFQFFEVWLDYVEDLDDVFVEKLINLLNDRLIVLFRRQKIFFFCLSGTEMFSLGTTRPIRNPRLHKGGLVGTRDISSLFAPSFFSEPGVSGSSIDIFLRFVILENILLGNFSKIVLIKF